MDSTDGPGPVTLKFDRYNFSHPRRGRAVIINNENFNYQITRQHQREGTAVDADALESVFVMLGFDVIRYNDVTSLDFSMNLRASRYSFV